MAEYFGFEAYDVEKYSDPFVFVSYKSEDSERVAVYARYLHDHGINVWYDNGLHAGSDWESYLMSVIEKSNCKAVLLFLSRKVAESTVIPLETTQARASKKPTVAVYLEPGLDVERLISKAVKVYVSQRQSVDAFAAPEETVCAKVLEAARSAMTNTASAASPEADALKKNAWMFLNNAWRSHGSNDISRAREYLEQMVQTEPSDYRGWLGLAMSECLLRPEDLENAVKQLHQCAGYYSYVMAADADRLASAEYTQAKSWLWSCVLDILRKDLESCGGTEDVKQLREKAGQIENNLGHTEPGVRHALKRILDEMDGRILRQESEAENQVQTAQTSPVEEAPAEPAGQFVWVHLSGRTAALEKYTGSAASVEIPASADGRRVTVIGQQAFSGSGVVSVIVPQSVRVIESGAFSGCCSLISAIIPKSVRKIGAGAFSGCPDLVIRSNGGPGSRVRRHAKKCGVEYKKVKIPKK